MEEQCIDALRVLSPASLSERLSMLDRKLICAVAKVKGLKVENVKKYLEND
jgi:hypothetical protein